jgi:transcriptional regulator NrdR family protein
MFGITMLTMLIADRLARRKNNERKRCDVCHRKFDTFENVEEHRRKVHDDVAA